MTLTEKQEKGLKIAVDRYLSREKYTVLAGYAGTGKSTLVKFIVEELSLYGVTESDICFATFTGKAAQVLLKKGNENACTLHKLLYKSVPLPNGGFKRIPLPFIPYKIVVVDEISMVDKELLELLFSHKEVHVICLGDPFQLPPINKENDNHLLDKPHIFLDQIMRQAEESEIIRLTMDIRAGRPLEYFQGKEVQVLPKADLSTGMMNWADQIICGTNSTRRGINNQMRELLGFEEEPQENDKVICLKNYWDILSYGEQPLVNGTIGFLGSPSNIGDMPIPTRISRFTNQKSYQMFTSNLIEMDTGEYFSRLPMDAGIFLKGEKSLQWDTEFKLRKMHAGGLPLDFDYAYAITCHKAQGSSWPKVLVIEEKFPFDKEEHARWLYTACTRPEEKLVLVR